VVNFLTIPLIGFCASASPFLQIFAAGGSWLALEAALTHRSFHLRQFA
jgi:hypothetical protein